MPYDVFGAYIDTVVVLAERLASNKTLKDLPKAPTQLVVFPPKFKIRSTDDFTLFTKTTDAVRWISHENNEFLVTLSDDEHSIIEKIRRTGGKFSDIADIQRGVTPFLTMSKPPKINPLPAFKGTVRRYRLIPSVPVFIRYDETLAEYKPQRYFQGPRVLLREMISRQFRLQASYTEESFITNKSMQSILLADTTYYIFYLFCLFNSKLLSWDFLAIHSVGRRDDFPKIVLKQTRDLPFRKINFSDSADKSRHNQMVHFVELILSLHKTLMTAKTDHEKTALKRQIDVTDRQIDQLVYELYGLTDEEIRIVEG